MVVAHIGRRGGNRLGSAVKEVVGHLASASDFIAGFLVKLPSDMA